MLKWKRLCFGLFDLFCNESLFQPSEQIYVKSIIHLNLVRFLRIIGGTYLEDSVHYKQENRLWQIEQGVDH